MTVKQVPEWWINTPASKRTGKRSHFVNRWRAIMRDIHRERWTTRRGKCFVCAAKPRKVLTTGILTMTCGHPKCMTQYLLRR